MVIAERQCSRGAWPVVLLTVVLTMPRAAAAHAPVAYAGVESGTVAEPAPPNPWGYTFGDGALLYNPPANFCDYFNCIATFWNGVGYVVECGDSTFSLSGGRTGVCSSHSNFLRNLYGPPPSATPSPGPTPSPSPTPSVSCGVERWSVKTGTDPDANA